VCGVVLWLLLLRELCVCVVYIYNIYLYDLLYCPHVKVYTVGAYAPVCFEAIVMEVITRTRTKKLKASDAMWQRLQERINADGSSCGCINIPPAEMLCVFKCNKPGGILMQCKHNCSNKTHLRCARNRGLSVNPNSEIEFECPKHMKNPLFCVCQTPYDEFREMICCERCNEWYHLECLREKGENVDDVDRYHCAGCAKIEDITSLRHRNESKELLSFSVIRATELITMLLEFESSVCSAIDMLDADDEVSKKLTPEDVERGLESYYTDNYNKVIENCLNHHCLDVYGLKDLLDEWQSRLTACEKSTNDAKVSLDESCDRIVRILKNVLDNCGASLNTQSLLPSEEAYTIINKTYDAAFNLVPPPPDLDQYKLFESSVEWIAEIHQVWAIFTTTS
jgi:hypothetical protein